LVAAEFPILAVVLILGGDGVAAAAAAGLLLTVTGTLGGLLFAGWAGADHLWSVVRRSAHRTPCRRAENRQGACPAA
jgi:hypothetical protein